MWHCRCLQDWQKVFARDGDRTHAHYCELDLKSNALTTRPPWHSRIYTFFVCSYDLWRWDNKICYCICLQDRQKVFARDGNRTHAHYYESDPRPNALTTRPPWHSILQRVLIFRYGFWEWYCKIWHCLRLQDRQKVFARDGDRTHAHYCELDLKSNALTTRPPWHSII